MEQTLSEETRIDRWLCAGLKAIRGEGRPSKRLRRELERMLRDGHRA